MKSKVKKIVDHTRGTLMMALSVVSALLWQQAIIDTIKSAFSAPAVWQIEILVATIVTVAVSVIVLRSEK